MGWRERAETPISSEGKPSLEAVLDHYAIEYRHRYSQMLHCPLQVDNTPSMSVDLRKGLWKCHSCGAGGDSWELIKRMEDTDFGGARRLAASVGLTEGDSGDGSTQLRGRSGRRRGGGGLPSQSRTGRGGGDYVPPWRRR